MTRFVICLIGVLFYIDGNSQIMPSVLDNFELKKDKYEFSKDTVLKQHIKSVKGIFYSLNNSGLYEKDHVAFEYEYDPSGNKVNDMFSEMYIDAYNYCRIEYSYKQGRVESETVFYKKKGNGIFNSYHYDACGRLSYKRYRDSSLAGVYMYYPDSTLRSRRLYSENLVYKLDSFTYTYDQKHRLQSIRTYRFDERRGIDTNNYVFVYDDFKRLKTIRSYFTKWDLRQLQYLYYNQWYKGVVMDMVFYGDVGEFERKRSFIYRDNILREIVYYNRKNMSRYKIVMKYTYY